MDERDKKEAEEKEREKREKEPKNIVSLIIYNFIFLFNIITIRQKRARISSTASKYKFR